MPKRKATTKLSGLVGSDDEDLIQMNGDNSAPEPDNERPAKRARGQPATKSAEDKAEAPQMKTRPTAEESAEELAPKKKRGRPKGSGGRSLAEGAEQQEPHQKEEAAKKPRQKKTKAQIKDAGAASDGGVEPPQKDTSKSTKSAKDTKPAATRGRKEANTETEVQFDDEFEYTPRSRKTKSPPGHNEQTEQPGKKGRTAEPEVGHATVPENQQPGPDVVEESFLPDLPASRRSVSASPTKADFRRRPSLGFSPQKRRAGEDGKAEPELRRKIGELTRKCETLENRYRNLREIGIIEANSNVEKLRKQCDSITTASNNLVNSLKEELAAQKALGQQSRQLQKQLGDRDAEVAGLKSQAGEAASQLSSAQTEVKALQTKLSAARNTAASLENAAAKAPGSAIKGGAANRANAAASAEIAHATQFAQLKEDLYSDLTGLIIRDVKKGETENLYDCIQTGANGTLHFKLSVPHVSAADFESAEFQYIPLLDEDRDRDLVAILPEYLTVEITFSRQQASKFYARVIDTLTKRRSSSSSSG